METVGLLKQLRLTMVVPLGDDWQKFVEYNLLQEHNFLIRASQVLHCSNFWRKWIGEGSCIYPENKTGSSKLRYQKLGSTYYTCSTKREWLEQRRRCEIAGILLIILSSRHTSNITIQTTFFFFFIFIFIFISEIVFPRSLIFSKVSSNPLYFFSLY